jgi:hypothetical protein
VIIFYNPGIIEPNAFRLSGASVKREGSFGRFGTGLKYGIATILRNQGTIVVHTGKDTYRFELETSVLREQCFSEVVMVEDRGDSEDVRTPLGFTVDLGKDWEPWMAVRELGCNARDEGGGFFQADEGADPALVLEDPLIDTVFSVHWPLIEAHWEDEISAIFCGGDILLETPSVRVLGGPSDYLYHRGVRVWKLPRPSVFTYDILSDVDLTEDRTVKYGFCVEADVRNMILWSSDRSIIAAAVSAGEKTWEGSFDWSGKQWSATDPGDQWLEEVARLREVKHHVAKSAVDVFLSHSAYRTSETYSGGTYDVPDTNFSEVIELIREDLKLDVSDLNFFITAELPGEALTTVRNGSVYVTQGTLDARKHVIAREVLTRALEVRSGGDHDRLLGIVVPLLIQQSWELKSSEKDAEEAAEWEAKCEAARARQEAAA